MVYICEEKQITTAYELDLCYQHIYDDANDNEIKDRCKIIALHGWLDNCASFTRLANSIAQNTKQPVEFVLLDLPGHGLSGHRHPQATYNLWDDIRDIIDLADQLGWERFSLMGHSRGAMICVLTAASLPQRIERMILLDGSIPPPVQPQEAPTQLAQHIKDNSARKSSRASLSYSSMEKALEARIKATGLPEYSERLLIARGVRVNDEGRFEWRADSRLRGASAVRLSLEQSKAFLEAINADTLIVMAKQGIGGDAKHIALLKSYPKLQVEVIDGLHHFHMLEQSDNIGAKVIEFLAKE